LTRAALDLTGTYGLAALMRPAGEDVLQKWPVSNRVSSSHAPNDDPSLIERLVEVSATSLVARKSGVNLSLSQFDRCSKPGQDTTQVTGSFRVAA
jgi:hypothetical protein